MSKLKKLLPRLLCYLLISLVIGGTAYSWNARKLAGNAMPMPFGIGMSVVLTGSMEPTLSPNDLVFVRAQESYQAGDVIVYQENYNLVVHRLISIDGDTAVTKGDANNVEDAPISTSQIKGKLVLAIPEIGLIIRLIQTLPGTITILVIAVLLLLRSRKSEREEQDAELDDIRRQIEELKHSIDEQEGQVPAGQSSENTCPEEQGPAKAAEEQGPKEPPSDMPKEEPRSEELSSQ